jgi:hypothetical protein
MKYLRAVLQVLVQVVVTEGIGSHHAISGLERAGLNIAIPDMNMCDKSAAADGVLQLGSAGHGGQTALHVSLDKTGGQNRWRFELSGAYLN